MKTKALSVSEMNFTDKTTGVPITMWRVYVADAAGNVGAITSRTAVKTGDDVSIGFAVRDGKLVAKIAEA